MEGKDEEVSSSIATVEPATSTEQAVTENVPQQDELPGNVKIKEEEVWIKPEIEEEVPESSGYIEPKVEISIEQDEQIADQSTMLPPKKRKELLEIKQEDMGCEESSTSEFKIENADESVKTEDEKAKGTQEKYIMYSYEITKNIQIVTITEEDRQIEHRQSVNSRRHMKYVCEHCAIGFVLEQPYLVHMKVHSKESGEHECDLCHCHLKTADMLYRHRLRHYRRYRCLLCWTRFKDKDTAACHVMTDHIGTAFECDHCGRVFKRPQYLKRHVEQYHTKPHRLECAVCFRVFHERGWYRSHIRTHNAELRANTVKVLVTCDICSRSFKNKSCLKRHLQSHDMDNLKCDICHLRCKNRNVLGRHYLEVHHEQYQGYSKPSSNRKRRAQSFDDLSCEICGEQYRNHMEMGQHYVKAHQKNYAGAPELTCEICLRVCATRAMLKRHMRRMHQDRTKKYQCDHCQRYYLTKGEVRSHIVWSHSSSGARGGHTCACGREFRTPSLLKDHTRRVHQQLPPPRDHACELCGKAFSNKQVLNRHKKSHSNEMYPCNECGLLFKTQPYVKIHYKIKHLNMTRAQIKAQAKLNKSKIAQNNLHTRPNWETPISSKKAKLTSNDNENDPLSVEQTEVKVKLERISDDDDEVSVPLFQTFLDVPRN